MSLPGLPGLPGQPNKPSQTNMFLASTVSGFFSYILNYPLFRIKNLLQTQTINPYFADKPHLNGALDAVSRVWKEEGWFGFLRGAMPGVFHHVFTRVFHLTSIVIGQSIDKKSLAEYHLESLPFQLLGIASYTVLYPMQFAQIQLACDYGPDLQRRYLGMNHSMISAYKIEKLNGLYRGLTPGLLQILLYQPIFLALSSAVVEKKPLLTNQDKIENQVKIRVMAVAAKALLYPLETVRNKMIMRTGNPLLKFTKMSECISYTMKNEGILGFYKGFQVELALFISGIILVGFFVPPQQGGGQ
jgi:hypothetical protein